MKIIQVCEAIDGSLHRTEPDALFQDFKVLKRQVEAKVSVLSVHRDEQQFFDVRDEFEKLFNKWQEIKQLHIDRDITKRKHTTRGVIETPRSERKNAAPLCKVA